MVVSPLQLLLKNQSVKGWYSGTSIDSQDTLSFSAHAGVRSMNEVLPLEKAEEGYQRMMSGTPALPRRVADVMWGMLQLAERRQAEAGRILPGRSAGCESMPDVHKD